MRSGFVSGQLIRGLNGKRHQPLGPQLTAPSIHRLPRQHWQVMLGVLGFTGWLTGRYVSMAIAGDIAFDLSISSFMIAEHRVVRQNDGWVRTSNRARIPIQVLA